MDPAVMPRAASLEGIGQTGTDDEEPLFPGVSPEMVARIKRMMSSAVADGIEQGAARVVQQHGTLVKVAVGATVIAALAALFCAIVLATKD